MKKLLASLLFVFLITPTFGENWIYLKSNAVETTIKEMVRADLQMLTATKYELEMDPNTGKISILGFYKVCAQAGFDIKKRDGYDRCQTFLQKMIAKSGLGSADQIACIEQLDGMWTTKSDGKKECVGRDGFALNYKNACTESGTNGMCIKRFQNANVQYGVAKSVATQVFSKYNLTCKNQKTTEKNPGKYLLCSNEGKPFTVEFAGFIPTQDSVSSRSGIAEMLCRIADQHYGAVAATYGPQFTGSFAFVCRRDNDQSRYVSTGDFIKNGSSECNQMNSWGKTFGGYQAGKAGTSDVVNVADGGQASKAVRGLCVITGGTMNESSLINELAADGFDNYAFVNIEVRNSEDVQERVREYVRTKLGAQNVKNIDCDTNTRRMNVNLNFLGLATESRDVLRCTINGKKIDFVFKSVAASGLKLKSGMQGLECITAGGVFDSRNCRLVGEENCKQLITALKTTCPDCKSPIWNAQDKKCILPDAKTQANINTGIKIAKIGGTVAAGVALTVIPGTQGGAAVAFTTAAADVLVITGAAVELTSEIIMETKVFNDFATQADQCYGKGEQCAINVLNNYLQKIQSYKKEFNTTEQQAVDEICNKLFAMIPSSSDFWLAFMQNEDVFDPVACTIKTKTQFWQKARTVGVVMQMVGAIISIGGKFQRSTETIGRKVEEKVLAIGGSGGQGERAAFKRLGLRYTFNGPAKDIGRLPYMDKAGIKFGASMKNVDATKILKDMYGITAEELYKATLNIDTGKVLLQNGKTIDAIIKTTAVIDEGKTITHITYDLTRAVRPTAAAVLAAGREAHYLSRKAPNGLKIPICLEKEDDFTPGDIVVIIEDEEEQERPDRIVGKPCAESDLPSNASAGVYITGGVAKWDCWDEKKQAIVKCSCAARDCKEPYKIARNNAGASLGYCAKEGARDSLNNCLAERAGNPEGIACCYLKSTVAKWDGTHCVCTGNKEFSIVNGAGVCKTSPKTACEESGGHWGTRSGLEECHCGTNQEYRPDGIYRDRGLKWSNDTYPTGVCMCLSGYQWVNTKNKQLGCKPI